MGKVLIIKDADFSNVSAGQVTLGRWLPIDLAAVNATNGYPSSKAPINTANGTGKTFNVGTASKVKFASKSQTGVSMIAQIAFYATAACDTNSYGNVVTSADGQEMVVDVPAGYPYLRVSITYSKTSSYDSDRSPAYVSQFID